MKNVPAISSLSVTVERAAAFKSQPHTNNTQQLAEQKSNVLALVFVAVIPLPLGQCSRVYKPCRKECLPWTRAVQLDLPAFFPTGARRIGPNQGRAGESSNACVADNGPGISAVTPVVPLSNQF